MTVKGNDPNEWIYEARDQLREQTIGMSADERTAFFRKEAAAIEMADSMTFESVMMSLRSRSMPEPRGHTSQAIVAAAAELVISR